MPNVLPGAAIGKVGTEAHATAIGIDGGDGLDSIDSNGKIDLSAVANATGASINVNLQGGAAVGDGRTSAEANTTGISGGAEKDSITLQSSSMMIGVSDAKTGTTGVSVNLIGAASVNANIDATARGTGIDGGDGDDTLTNLGTIDWTAMSDARASSVSVNLVGAALGGATTLSTATATGIAGGDRRRYDRELQGTVTLTADAKTKSGGVTVSLAGNAEADSNIQAIASAVGIDGGSGKDAITSSGAIKSTATADAPATSVNVNIAGTALGDARTTAEANSIGIRGGEGDDTLLNFSTIEASSTATTSAHNVSVVIAGLASSSRDVLTATTNASGIVGNEGSDFIGNEGDVTVTATSTTTISGSTVNIFGVSQSGGTANTNVTAVGLDGGAADDVITNLAKLTVGSTGTMTIDRGNFEFGGVASADGTLISMTRATGIAGGDGADQIRNEGEIQVTSSSALTATGDTTAVFGLASAGAALNANARAIGIDGGEGADNIINIGILKATSSATMTSARPSFTCRRQLVRGCYAGVDF